ncbi:DUF4231 domain-containing protein [Alicyclobacillus fastidiosus]|uniref:DUF4231 domain-containing protein n=1 Tax=Alicyclobacillus fastidiosus TaxID=392011 RepID=UPI0023E93553|nr:DUF4231 domain-containing protein [Alicyclobacillus fastidiosus]GMA60297.1 hypothetical protein GCM10025859_07370 [Alicyclobacillus fastidiosus]
MDEQNYLSERVDHQIQWFDDKSKFNQRWYKGLKLSQIIFSALIPLLVGFVSDFVWIKVLVGSLGVLVAIVTGFMEVFGFHENWIHYRQSAERLYREKYLFLTKCSPYQEGDAFKRFVTAVEGGVPGEP